MKFIKCSIENCDSGVHSRGWCNRHYQRWYLHGDPTYVIPKELRKGYSPPKDKECSIDGCLYKTKTKSGKYCRRHFYYFKTYGDPLVSSEEDSIKRKREKRVKVFWDNVEVGDENSCWNWKGVTRSGNRSRYYGYLGSTRAHRFSFELHFPEKDLKPFEPVHHTCNNTICVNPKHLQSVSQQENTAEMLERKYYLKRIKYLENLLSENNIQYSND